MRDEDPHVLASIAHVAARSSPSSGYSLLQHSYPAYLCGRREQLLWWQRPQPFDISLFLKKSEYGMRMK
jgi:hypothetical protein